MKITVSQTNGKDKLLTLFKLGKYSDIVLELYTNKVLVKSVKCHKALLEVYSPPLHEQIVEHERVSGTANIYRLQDLKAEEVPMVEGLIRVMYGDVFSLKDPSQEQQDMLYMLIDFYFPSLNQFTPNAAGQIQVDVISCDNACKEPQRYEHSSNPDNDVFGACSLGLYEREQQKQEVCIADDVDEELEQLIYQVNKDFM